MNSNIGPEVNIYQEGTNIIDVDKLNNAMKWWLDVFKEQLELLHKDTAAFRNGNITECELIETITSFEKYEETNQKLLSAVKAKLNGITNWEYK